MNPFHHALKSSWHWKRHLFALVPILLVINFLYLGYFPFRGFALNLIVIMVSLAPLLFGKKDQFSWKYLQSLPISRSELFSYMIWNHLLTFIPGAVFSGILFGHILGSEGDSISYKAMLVLTMAFVFIFSFMSIVLFYNLYEITRAAYTKNRALIYWVQQMRNFIGFFLVAALLFALAVTVWHYLLMLAPDTSELIRKVFRFLTLDWGGVLTFSLLLAGSAQWVYKRWREEKRSYKKINFRAQRDVPLMVTGVALIVFTVSQLNREYVPVMYGYQHSKIIDHYFDHGKKLSTLSPELLDEINKTSETGFTPIMVAAHEGDLAFYNLLKKHGASLEGKVNRPQDKDHHQLDLFMLAVDGKNLEIVHFLINKQNANASNGEFSALHLAARDCSTDLVDLLLETGADPNALTIKQRTPLHSAARGQCFSAVVSLLEHGAQPLLKDKEGKVARDYVRDSSKDLNYFLEKKGRSPAQSKE